MSDSSRASLESAGIKLIKTALEHEKANRLREALNSFTEGIDILISVNKEIQDKEKKASYAKQISNYMDHAEQLKETVARQQRERPEERQVCIEEKDTGHTYESLFGWCIDDTVSVVEIDDPYIYKNHQVKNLVRFCELVLTKSKAVREIKLQTQAQTNDARCQEPPPTSMLSTLAQSLEKFNVTLTVIYSEHLHDREIRFSNGWVVKIGRGLDIYQRCEPYAIGASDYSFRQCKKTTVDFIWRQINPK